MLIFDVNRDFKPGGEYVCERCGKKVSGRWIDGAWVAKYRYHYAANFESAAVMALLGDEDARQFMVRFLDFYAENYEGFPMHTYVHFCYRGKLMPQMLDEATWCSGVLRALYPCMGLFTKEQLSFWQNRLFKPIIDIITDPKHTHCINNHEFKRMCTGGMYSLMFGDEAYRYTIDGEYGIRDQIERGYTKEGFWFECSTTYHYFASDTFTYFCQILADKDPQNTLLDRLKAIYAVPMKISHDGWNIPSLNDGRYPANVSLYADQIYRAAMCSGAKELTDQLDRISELAPERLDVPAVLLIENSDRKVSEEAKDVNKNSAVTEVLPGTKLAVIREPLFAVLKSGVVDESHRHDDCLNIIISPVSDDLGCLPYTHPMHPTWRCRAASHNTVAVNGTQPKAVIPTHVESTDSSISAVIDSGWDGVTSAARTLTAVGDKLTDVTEVVLDKEGTVDWFFHLDWVTDITPRPGEQAELGEGEGYEHFKDVRRVVGDRLTVHSEKDGYSLTLDIPIDGVEAFVAVSPSNPVCNFRTAVILRHRGKKARFEAEYSK